MNVPLARRRAGDPSGARIELEPGRQALGGIGDRLAGDVPVRAGARDTVACAADSLRADHRQSHRVRAQRRGQRGRVRRAQPAGQVIAGARRELAAVGGGEVVLAGGDVVEVRRVRRGGGAVQRRAGEAQRRVPAQAGDASVRASSAAHTGAAPLVPPMPCQPDGWPTTDPRRRSSRSGSRCSDRRRPRRREPRGSSRPRGRRRARRPPAWGRSSAADASDWAAGIGQNAETPPPPAPADRMPPVGVPELFQTVSTGGGPSARSDVPPMLVTNGWLPGSSTAAWVSGTVPGDVAVLGAAVAGGRDDRLALDGRLLKQRVLVLGVGLPERRLALAPGDADDLCAILVDDLREQVVRAGTGGSRVGVGSLVDEDVRRRAPARSCSRCPARLLRCPAPRPGPAVDARRRRSWRACA